MTLPTQCALCRHYGRELRCTAFPNGIPEEILTNEHDHTEPFPGDHGVHFEPIDGTPEGQTDGHVDA